MFWSFDSTRFNFFAAFAASPASPAIAPAHSRADHSSMPPGCQRCVRLMFVLNTSLIRMLSPDAVAERQWCILIDLSILRSDLSHDLRLSKDDPRRTAFELHGYTRHHPV